MSDALYQDEDSILKHPTPSLRDKLKLKPKTLEDSFVSTDESIGPLRPDEDRTGLYESEADEGPSGINQVHSDNEEDSFLNDEGEVSLQEGDTLTMEQSGRNAFLTKVAVSALEPAGSSRPPASTRSQPATQAVGSPKPLPEVTTLAPTRTDSKEKNTLCYCGTCLHSVNTLTQEKKEQHPCRRLNKDSEFLNLTMAEAKAMRVMRREREIAEQDVRGVKRKHDDDDEGIEDQPSAPTKRKTRQGSHQVTNEAKASTKVNTNDEAPHRKSSRKAGTTLLKAGSRSITKGKTRVKADEQKAKTESKVRTNGKRKRETGAEVDEVESEHKKGRVKRV
ncbi:hypothetical protein P7C71_g1569, partial [Lecanoromycetidae sp. Uapishka_2]